jgi:hypothetical protein
MTESEVVICIKLVAQQPLSPSEGRIEGIDEVWLYLYLQFLKIFVIIYIENKESEYETRLQWKLGNKSLWQ